MKVGICGYPGSGKSTVFSALAPGSTPKEGVTYGSIKVPDERIDRLAAIFSPKKQTYAEITFLDVGGSGFSGHNTGAFPPDVVQHMRNADVLVHVVRVFDNPMLAEPADPESHVQMFDDELVLLDLEILDKRKERWRKENRKGREVEVNDRCCEHLEAGEPLRTLELEDEHAGTLRDVQLLSRKPLIVLYNLGEEEWDEHEALREVTLEGGKLSLGICGATEAEIAELDADEQGEFLEVLGLEQPRRVDFVQGAYAFLGLISFLTAGPDECRAWPIRKGVVAKKAAGKVHSDIERGFIRAEVYRLEDLERLGSEAALKKEGLIRVEGKDYVVVDGDVVNYRFNV